MGVLRHEASAEAVAEGRGHERRTPGEDGPFPRSGELQHSTRK